MRRFSAWMTLEIGKSWNEADADTAEAIGREFGVKTVRLLGDLNWYLPRWLRWLPELNVEGTVAPKHPA